jgi:hypothetical protein
MIEPRFYINPQTGRLIKSTGRVFKRIKEQGEIRIKHKCLYNINTAKKCIMKLLMLYPDIYPPSNFINIPKTYKDSYIRGYIKDNYNKKIIGFVDKKGKKYKLKRPIPKFHNDTLIIKDVFNILSDIMDTKQSKLDETMQKFIENNIKLPPLISYNEITLLYNPLQNDIIYISRYTTRNEQKRILHTINKELVPKKLPTITKNFNIAGIIRNKYYIFGIIDDSNIIKRFAKPLSMIEFNKNIIDNQSDSKSLKELSEIESESSSLKELTETETETESASASASASESASASASASESESESLKELTESESESESASESESESASESASASESLKELTETESESESLKELSETESESESLKELSEIESESESESESEPTKDKSDIKIIETIPQVTVLKKNELKELEKEIEKSPILSEIEQTEIVKSLQCLDGEQFDVDEKRCLPCAHYDLVWDSETKACKPLLKEDVKIEKGKSDGEFEKIELVMNKHNEILGYI